MTGHELDDKLMLLLGELLEAIGDGRTRPSKAQLREIEDAYKLVCSIAGHMPTADQCGKPEHDHCLLCGVTLPGQAPREVKT